MLWLTIHFRKVLTLRGRLAGGPSTCSQLNRHGDLHASLRHKANRNYRRGIVLERSEPIRFTVAPLGHVNSPETQNAVSLANAIQQAFRFLFYPEVVPLEGERYKLKNGALDLDTAVRALLKRQNFRRLASGLLILVTSMPYSDQDSADEYIDQNLLRQCYFYDEKLSYAKNIALVSTYIWENLPGIINLSSTNSRRRALQPYLLMSFAIIALNQYIDLPYHDETRGCPQDYCYDVRDADRFFERGRFCDECERFLHRKQRNGEITAEQIDSAKKLLRRATGSAYEYDVAISFAGSERQLAEQIAALIREAGFKVFYDDFYPEELVGKNLTEFFDDVYRKNSRFCVILVSSEYERRMWTTEERQKAQARAREEMGNDYIIPIVIDYSELSGLLNTTGYLSLKERSLEQIAQIVIRKLQLKGI